ncbi:hypothetical protein MTsPCn9_11020 [Croceitalea sp. MTPC9]|nr:hypothetical protein MTsPCn6_26220 [Croceitalea sp. MTPC6]GMN16166.1 hypothetical protein MTsPCn9_11020 [Croceitalea sp. MTPC9]
MLLNGIMRLREKLRKLSNHYIMWISNYGKKYKSFIKMIYET